MPCSTHMTLGSRAWYHLALVHTLPNQVMLHTTACSSGPPPWHCIHVKSQDTSEWKYNQTCLLAQHPSIEIGKSHLVRSLGSTNKNKHANTRLHIHSPNKRSLGPEVQTLQFYHPTVALSSINPPTSLLAFLWLCFVLLPQQKNLSNYNIPTFYG